MNLIQDTFHHHVVQLNSQRTDRRHRSSDVSTVSKPENIQILDST